LADKKDLMKLSYGEKKTNLFVIGKKHIFIGIGKENIFFSKENNKRG